MKKIGIVALIGLLLATGLILVGCEFRQCPGDGNCEINITGTGSGYIVNSRTGGCNDSKCQVNSIKSGTSGDNFTITCWGCDSK